MSLESPKVVLCICTYRRPDGLRKLLEALPALENAPNLEVVVADNDAGKEGLAVCQFAEPTLNVGWGASLDFTRLAGEPAGWLNDSAHAECL